MKKLLFALGFVVAAALAAAVAAPWLIDAGQYRDELARRVSAATGREVAIDGPVAFVLLPSPRVRASDVRIVAAEADAPATIDAKHVELELGWASLFGRALEITHLRVIEPRVVIAAARSPAPGSVPQLGPIAPVRIERTEIQNGRVVWSDPSAKTPRTVEQLQATILASPLASSIRVAGSAVASAVPFEFDAVIGEAPPGRPNPVSLTMGLRPGLARATLRGSYDAAARALRGKVQIEGSELYAAVATMRQVPPMLAGIASQPFSASGDINWSSAGIAANDLVLQLGDTRATGAINATSGQTLSVDVALAVTWLDLDKLAQLERRAATPQRALRPAETTGARLGVSQLPSVASAYPAIDLALDLGIEAVGLNGGTLRQMRLNAVMSRGDLVINQASALLPGETEVAGFAQIAFGVDTPRIDGNISARSDNLRGLLEWFGLDSSGVPAGRLRRFEGKARIEGTPSHVELTGVHVAFDSTKATAGFAVALGDRLGIGADIKVDQINVDAYALAADAAKAGKDKPPLLERFDANVTLAAHTVTWAGEPLNGVSLDALLQGGDVVLRSAVISEVLGARVEARGKVASVARRPSASLEVSVDAGDASRLLRLADLVPFTPVPLSLRGGLQTEPNGEIALDGIDLTYGDTHLRGKGRLGGAKKRLAVDLATQHLMIDSLPRVLPDDGGSFGLDAVINAETLSWGVYRLAGARVEAHIDGGAPVALDVTGGLFGGALDFTARSEAADRGKLGGSLSLRDADLASGFAAVLGTDAISGRGDLRAAFSAPARFGSEIWAGLSGSIEMTVRDGAIAGIDLPLMRSMLDPNDPPADIVDLLGAGLHGATPFTALNATARVQQGALAIETLRVATPVGEATGSGGADLARGTVDLSLTVPIAGDGVPPILLQVKGPVDEARVALDFSKLQRYLNRREAEMPGQDDSTQ